MRECVAYEGESVLLDYDRLASELLEAGMQPVRVREMVKQFKQDMSEWPEEYSSWERVEWSLKHGFLPGRRRLWGDSFSEETFQDYYDDYNYFMAHPLNNHFGIWINDKLTLKYMLNNDSFRVYMPEYYLYIENDGHYTYLMDSPSDIDRDEDYLLNLLKQKKHLAMKPNHGAGGEGFVDLSYDGESLYRNRRRISEDDYAELIKNLHGYIVTEYIKQCAEMEAVFPYISSALRIILYKKVKDSFAAADEYGYMLGYARFATRINEAASNNDQGGLSVTIDWDKGEFAGGFRGLARFWGEEGVRGFDAHPDTGIALDGMAIPNWNTIKTGLIEICKYLSSLDFFGFDVIITNDGFKLCEVNSAPSIGRGQSLYGKGCLDNDDARRFAQSKKRQAKKNLEDCFRASIIKL